MQKDFLETPILFIIFNRPNTTKKVFEKIREVKPKKFYIIQDGARNENEKELLQEVRDIIKIDWDCEVFTDYSEKNLGPKKRISSGISWFFENEERGIILEDDCVPEKAFFYFCEEMLERYKNDERVGMIGGSNFQMGKIKNKYSYYFSKNQYIWGWATWRRVWQKYDVNMESYKENKDELKNIFKGNVLRQIYWKYIFDRMIDGRINTWDYQLAWMFFTNNYLGIYPSVNLVKNIGVGKGAANTKFKFKAIDLKTQELSFPLEHPKFIMLDNNSDKITERVASPMFRFFASKAIKAILRIK